MGEFLKEFLLEVLKILFSKEVALVTDSFRITNTTLPILVFFSLYFQKRFSNEYKYGVFVSPQTIYSCDL